MFENDNFMCPDGDPTKVTCVRAGIDTETVEGFIRVCELISESAGILAAEAAVAILCALTKTSEGMQQTEENQLPMKHRCRICGRRYANRGEAKDCERKHNRPFGR